MASLDAADNRLIMNINGEESSYVFQPMGDRDLLHTIQMLTQENTDPLRVDRSTERKDSPKLARPFHLDKSHGKAGGRLSELRIAPDERDTDHVTPTRSSGQSNRQHCKDKEAVLEYNLTKIDDPPIKLSEHIGASSDIEPFYLAALTNTTGSSSEMTQEDSNGIHTGSDTGYPSLECIITEGPKLPCTRKAHWNVLCTVCGHVCPNKGERIKHMRKHTQDKPYACPVQGCSFRTRYPGNVKHHMSTHFDDRPWACDLCPLAFKSKSQLSTHMEIHSDEKPFTCDFKFCNYRSKRRWSIKLHKLCHSDQRFFKCDICQFEAKTKSDLTKHKTKHLDERNYKCMVCGKSYKCGRAKRKHERDAHSTVRFSCPVCRKQLRRRANLRQHILRFHSQDGFLPQDHPLQNIDNAAGYQLDRMRILEADSVSCPLYPLQEQGDGENHENNMDDKDMIYYCDCCGVCFGAEHEYSYHLTTEEHRQTLAGKAGRDIAIERGASSEQIETLCVGTSDPQDTLVQILGEVGPVNDGTNGYETPVSQSLNLKEEHQSTLSFTSRADFNTYNVNDDTTMSTVLLHPGWTTSGEIFRGTNPMRLTPYLLEPVRSEPSSPTAAGLEFSMNTPYRSPSIINIDDVQDGDAGHLEQTSPSASHPTLLRLLR